ncbi:MAG: peptidase T [Candidatus Limivicinus sp.]|nr:peptidase T [Candidatus Limivicinus sp.]
MRAYERLLKYAAVDTQSSEDAQGTPSTPGQLTLCRILAEEMRSIGLEEVYEDGRGYVYGKLPASAGMEKAPAIGFIAHVDTAPDFSGAGVKPVLHVNYDGGDLPLGDSGLVLSPEKFPDLKDSVGQTLITTDGTTLLGADDKAGVAEIMTACERIISEKLPHCALSVAFTPDEEIGSGAQLLDLARFGADFAYTVDGDEIGEINYETFNAAGAGWEITGVSVHPGSARGIMVNAALVAAEINSMLPAGEIPAETDGYEGFYHLTELNATVERAEMKYIVRDHDAKKFAARLDKLRAVEKHINEKYGEGTAKLTLTEQYRNMEEILSKRMDIVERAKRAVEKLGIAPVIRPIRGGTDGAQLSFLGLPCPNLGTGGSAFHGPFEHITAEHMDQGVEVLLNIVSAG